MNPYRFLAGIGALCGTTVYVVGVVIYYAASRLAERKPDPDAEELWSQALLLNARR